MGLLIVFTGNGKGKTTAALGMSMRAAGHGMRVLILQFIKGSRTYGELQSMRKTEEVEIIQLGTGFTWKKENLDEDRRLAQAGWEKAVFEINRQYHDIIVLDELNIVLSMGLLPADKVIETLKNRPDRAQFVVTGRNAPEALISIADLVTEMREIKHPYHSGVKATKGVEF
jgi:cob(I)alamin adenosyltransferase